MPIKRYGFIVLAPGYRPDEHTAIIENPAFRTEVVCVASVAEAISVAHRFDAAGMDVIELCGGFGEAGMAEVTQALNSDTPVGYVEFTAAEHEKLTRRLAR